MSSTSTPATTAKSLKSRIENLIAMAQLLERVDANPALVGAVQYQNLARLVQSLLAEELPDDALRHVLRSSPAAAALYENMHYDRSGLSQSPLPNAIESELAASEIIERIRARAQPAA